MNRLTREETAEYFSGNNMKYGAMQFRYKQKNGFFEYKTIELNPSNNYSVVVALTNLSAGADYIVELEYSSQGEKILKS